MFPDYNMWNIPSLDQQPQRSQQPDNRTTVTRPTNTIGRNTANNPTIERPLRGQQTKSAAARPTNLQPSGRYAANQTKLNDRQIGQQTICPVSNSNRTDKSTTDFNDKAEKVNTSKTQQPSAAQRLTGRQVVGQRSGQHTTLSKDTPPNGYNP